MADIEPVPNRGPQLLGVNIFFLIIALLACLLRMYTRLFMVKAFGTDDGLMLLSTVRVAGGRRHAPSPGPTHDRGV